MKDAYSFDRDEDGVDAQLRGEPRGVQADLRALRPRDVRRQAESGIMGGKFSVDFLAPSGSGENTLVTLRERRLRGRPRDRARPCRARRRSPRRSPRRRRSRRPASTTMRGARRVPRHRPRRDLEGDAGDEARTARVVLALVRGDDRLSEIEARTTRSPASSRPATDEEIRAAFGAGGGSLGPVGFKGEIDRRRDAARRPVRRRREPRRLAPARRRGGPRLRAALRRPPRAEARATAARSCGGALHFQTAIEVGHIFNFGSFYSKPLDATFLDEDGQEKPLLGGSYGIGPGRVMAAIVEQHHDENGIAWPRSVAPYDVHVVALAGRRGDRRAGRRGAVGRRPRRAARRPRPAGGGEVRRRRPDRRARSASPRARRASRTARSTCATGPPAATGG